jgi:hypothetical protein
MKFSQAPSSIVMVRPASFGSNPQTASTNAFQKVPPAHHGEISNLAVEEFDRAVEKLRAHDIDVIVVEDSLSPQKPDAIFPNNWISFHEDGSVILYPMMAENRRLERKIPILEIIKTKFHVNQVLDYSQQELSNEFLEGTGSVVFDYQNKTGYASRSARTHEGILNEVCLKLGYKPVLFDAVDECGHPIYHTNVLMCVGTRFSVICLDAIKRDEDQETLLDLMSTTKHQVIAISFEQMKMFAGNMIEVTTNAGEHIVLLSEQAFNSLLPGQINAISKHAELLPLSIDTIERYGGGSVRCMVAGVFNKKL